MRWALVKVALAVTTMVVVAFAVPLGLVVKEMASDRAYGGAERQAAALGPVLAITTDRTQLERALASAETGPGGRIGIHVPAAGKGGNPAEIGARRAAPPTSPPRSGSAGPPSPRSPAALRCSSPPRSPPASRSSRSTSPMTR
ncbi:putative two-component system sensor kinase [Streptomyces noursei]|nr:putative two-component system sensor kinase [Streptomyces noursei]